MVSNNIELFYKKEARWNLIILVMFILMVSFNAMINIVNSFDQELKILLKVIGKYFFYISMIVTAYNYLRKRNCPNDHSVMKRVTAGATVAYECKKCGLKIDTIMGALP